MDERGGQGPEAILEASVNLEFYDIETASEVHLAGFTLLPRLMKTELPIYWLMLLDKDVQFC